LDSKRFDFEESKSEDEESIHEKERSALKIVELNFKDDKSIDSMESYSFNNSQE